MVTDYIVLGSVGYAQVSQDDYFKKEKVESAVLVDLIINNSIFKIPDEFLSNCFLRLKKFQHDFGSYKELCLIYNQDFFDDLEDDEELNEKFWNWVNEMECFDYESEEILEMCNKKHREIFNLEVHYKKGNETGNNLKIANG